MLDFSFTLYAYIRSLKKVHLINDSIQIESFSMRLWNTCKLSLGSGSISMFNMKFAINLTDSIEQTLIPFTQGCFVPVLLKLAQWFWRRRFLIWINVFSRFLNHLPLEKGVALHLNKLESPFPKVVLCQVWLKLA